MKYDTNTFTTSERESLFRGYGKPSELIDIQFCSYCGQKAIRKDIGSSRYEEIIHYCTCEDAQQEMQIKASIDKLESEIYKQKRELENMKKKTDNSIVNKIKFENELNKLKKKYKI